ncbi:MAG TPA: hypothetical protein VK090_06250 [Paracoccaceae bacterium]|nr:hypothetical protein [Paracoccaceae bacterium]
MQFILAIVGTLALIFAFFAAGAARSDIQIGIAVNATLGAFILFGFCAVLDRLKSGEKALREFQSVAPPLPDSADNRVQGEKL